MSRHQQERLAELNARLAYLQVQDDPRDSEEFVRLYQERRALLNEIGLQTE